MSAVTQRHFDEDWAPLAEAISRLEVPQETREHVAEKVTDALRGRQWFSAGLFQSLASDPMVDCGGPSDEEPCPYARSSRIRMHLDGGRAATWRSDKPEWWCLDCGMVRFSND